MESQKVDMFIMSNNKYFESHQVGPIRDRLETLNEEEWRQLHTIQFRDPTISLIVSLIGGQLGIDRFMIGDTGLGIGKLLTCGGFGIWAIIDWFMIMGATRERNLEKLQRALSV